MTNVKPIFYSIVIDDKDSKIKNACWVDAHYKFKSKGYDIFVKILSRNSELKFRYILDLCQSLQSKGRKFILYINHIDGLSGYTGDDYIKELNILKINVARTPYIFKKEEFDGVIIDSLKNQKINIPCIEAIIICNTIPSPMTFYKLVEQGRQSYKNKEYCYIYEVFIDINKEIIWSNGNFMNYEISYFPKERIYVKL